VITRHLGLNFMIRHEAATSCWPKCSITSMRLLFYSVKVFCRYQGNLAHPAEAGPVSCAFGIAVACKPAAFDRRDLLDSFHRRASSARHIDPLYEAGHTTSLLAAKCPESLCPNDRRGDRDGLARSRADLPLPVETQRLSLHALIHLTA
jgi:hypothetical protein